MCRVFIEVEKEDAKGNIDPVEEAADLLGPVRTFTTKKKALAFAEKLHELGQQSEN